MIVLLASFAFAQESVTLEHEPTREEIIVRHERERKNRKDFLGECAAPMNPTSSAIENYEDCMDCCGPQTLEELFLCDELCVAETAEYIVSPQGGATSSKGGEPAFCAAPGNNSGGPLSKETVEECWGCCMDSSDDDILMADECWDMCVYEASL